MPARVTLKAVQGELSGQEFTYDERTTCIIGRAKDCSPRVPGDDLHRFISRHHCLLDINPPDIRVRDFGSLNGTHVNGRSIGRRPQEMSARDAARLSFPEHDLHHGDEIRLEHTVFRVSVHLPTYCADCAQEIPEGEQAGSRGGAGIFRCTACQQLAEESRRKAEIAAARCCIHCGKDASAEIGEGRRGEYVCRTCQSDPFALLRALLSMADQGERGLGAIQGYTIIRELGRGGMGAVYLARQDRSGEEMALKVMLPQVAMDERAKQMFQRETANTQALRHAHVVQLRESGCSQGTFFLTLEFCDGGSVDRLMRQQGGTLPIDQALPIILQTLDGLSYAHQANIPNVKLADGRIGRGRGLVHRDLKPQNIFLSGAGPRRVAKVGDYGLAKAFDTAGLSGQTATGTAAGTPCFMPRQQVVNFKFAKPEVDVWAAAASLYCMLTGFVPRDFPNDHDPWSVVLSTSAVPIRKRNPSVPKRLAEAIDHALIDKPEIQVKSAAEFRRMLERAI